jgi:hypothetical protein
VPRKHFVSLRRLTRPGSTIKLGSAVLGLLAPDWPHSPVTFESGLAVPLPCDEQEVPLPQPKGAPVAFA